MIDGDSASAAEIFAGAIRDHRRGVIVGERSYGKGSVQGIFPLSIGEAGIRLTTAKFYSPAGHPYSTVGVTPDVTVHKAARPIHGQVSLRTAESDPALNAAVETARRLGMPR
jgi:carboxyl-terminal processing protease